MRQIFKTITLLTAALACSIIMACGGGSSKSKETVATPTANPAAGEVTRGTTVSLSTTTAGAEIWYSTDGSTPSKDGTGSTKYESPIPVMSAVTIKAIAVKDGITSSGILEVSYTTTIPEGMVWIEAGKFMMGSPETEVDRLDREGPQREVTITSGFCMSENLVTQAEYEAVMGTNPSYFTASELPAGANAGKHPVETVSWYDAVEYCNALSIIEGLTPAYTIDKVNQDPNNTNTGDTLKWTVTLNSNATGYRLPTEAQWEYACRAGTTSAFNWGTNTINDTQANFYSSYVDNYNLIAGTYLGRTTEVGSYAPNDWGLYDMHGNLWEWCWDWYDGEFYSTGTSVDPAGAVSGSNRVRRGGYWSDLGQYLRSACRGSYRPSRLGDSVGFRVVCP